MSDIILKKAKSPSELLKMKFKAIGLEGQWKDHLGEAAGEGSWFICGQSGHGKTHYAMMLAKYLCNFGRVAYNSIEEGESATVQSAFERLSMADVDKKFVLLNQESLQEMNVRLKRHKSADYIFIDSLQTLRYDVAGTRGITYNDYLTLLATFKHKLFIFISKAKGSAPWNDMALNIKFDSDIKIWVENYYANVETTRFKNGGQSFDIWPERM